MYIIDLNMTSTILPVPVSLFECVNT